MAEGKVPEAAEVEPAEKDEVPKPEASGDNTQLVVKEGE